MAMSSGLEGVGVGCEGQGVRVRVLGYEMRCWGHGIAAHVTCGVGGGRGCVCSTCILRIVRASRRLPEGVAHREALALEVDPA